MFSCDIVVSYAFYCIFAVTVCDGVIPLLFVPLGIANWFFWKDVFAGVGFNLSAELQVFPWILSDFFGGAFDNDVPAITSPTCAAFGAAFARCDKFFVDPVGILPVFSCLFF